MEFLKLPQEENELILDTPNRNEILKEGPPENAKCNVLGRGSYGVVFKAVYGGKQVAVKILKNEKVNAISNESNILGWRHRNIVQLLKIEATANYGIVIMERFPGQCLQLVLDSIEIPLVHRIYVALDVINALIYCHNHQTLHLDVKPQNVIVASARMRSGRKGKVSHNRSYICKLCDFGSSITIDQGNTCRRVQGTVRYMSPEALREDTVSPAADVYSLGVTMWQLKSRQLPYSWIECNESVAYQVVKTHLRPTSKPAELNAQVTTSNQHQNCLCQHFSSEISHKSLDHIRKILKETKTLSPFQPKNPGIRQGPAKLRNQVSRSLIGTFQSTFAGLKENLLIDETSCDIPEKELGDGFLLKEMFQQKAVSPIFGNEELYEDMFRACWSKEVHARPKTFDLKRRLISLLLPPN